MVAYSLTVFISCKLLEALAVIKYYELPVLVLVLCPKRLRDNWALYEGNSRNILLRDRFNYDMLNHADLTHPKGCLATSI